MENEQYYGHKTMTDGTHIPLSKDEVEAILEQMKKQKSETAAKYPDEQSTLIGLFEAYHRLSDFGWRDAIYCPKDGSIFDVIEAGSTGIHKCHYEGKWPNGSWWIHGDGDLWPSRPILFRLPNPPQG